MYYNIKNTLPVVYDQVREVGGGVSTRKTNFSPRLAQVQSLNAGIEKHCREIR